MWMRSKIKQEKTKIEVNCLVNDPTPSWMGIFYRYSKASGYWADAHPVLSGLISAIWSLDESVNVGWGEDSGVSCT
jgi:DNA gyrase inhibitor GyrI